MNIGDAIKQIRKAQGISQKDLAIKCGLSANAMCSIEKNDSIPSRESIAKICEALNIPTSYLLLFSVTEDDVPADKRVVFSAMKTILLDGMDRYE